MDAGASSINLLDAGVAFIRLKRAVTQSCLSTGWQQRIIKSAPRGPCECVMYM